MKLSPCFHSIRAHYQQPRRGLCHVAQKNILLDSWGFAKIGDFGVCHCFDDEADGEADGVAPRSFSLNARNLAQLGGSSSAQITRAEAAAALEMKPMSDAGQLTKAEGTWAYWSPEMCAEDSLFFSGYACDIWAAGICLHVFATGRLPFYSDVPTALFAAIAAANLDVDGAALSPALRDTLGRVLTRDPAARAGVGELLRHPFCRYARTRRLEELGEELDEAEMSEGGELGDAETLEEDDGVPPSRWLFPTITKKSISRF